MALSEQVSKVNGRNVRYYEAGEPHQKSIVFLHGGFGDAWLHWADVMPQFTPDYHVIAPDLPGYGQTERLADMSLPNLMQWVLDFIHTLGLEQAAVVGHSFGGLIGRVLAANHPQSVPVLVLVNGGVIPNVPPAARLISSVPVLGAVLYGQFGRTSASRSSITDAVFVKKIVTDPFYNRVKANTGGLSGMMRGLATSPIPEQRIPRVPVLVIWGEHDTITPLAIGERIYKNIAGSQFSDIAECGHLPHLEVPDVFVWQIKNFLQGLDRR